MSISFKPPCLLLFIAFLINLGSAADLGKHVIVAVNCGGPGVTGAHGIRYSEDPSKDGVASDHGMQYSFNNADSDDMEIYQTERWSSESFGYDIPAGDGEYVIILKFSEVYFQKPEEKVFHVRINTHTAVKNLDIFEASGGRGFAHDIHVPIVIQGDSIYVQGHPKKYNGKIIIELVKGPHDNPKINAFAVVRGKLDQMPPLPERFVSDSSLEEDFDLYETDYKDDNFQGKVISGDDNEEDIEMFAAPPSGAENPFEKDNSIWWLAGLVSLVMILPLAFFCRWNRDLEQ